MRMAVPALFCGPLACMIVFHPFTLSLCLSCCDRWDSCKQHMVGLCFLIHPPTLCLLMGEFKPLTFIDIMDLMYCSAIVLKNNLFTLIYYKYYSDVLVYKRSFSTSFRAGLVIVASFNCCLSKKVLIPPSSLNESLAGYIILG